MNREQIVNVVLKHLSGIGSLVVDYSNKTVEATASTGIVEWGSYVVVDEILVNEHCDCGETFNEDCEQCENQVNYLVEKVEAEFNKGITLAEFLEMASQPIETQIEKEMKEMGQYANLSHIINLREQYQNQFTDIYDNADRITEEQAKRIVHEFEFNNYTLDDIFG